MSEYLLEMRNITKEFPGVRALENVTFQVRKGEILALIGENGAGKSTLMKILSGFYPYGTYTGDIVLDGQVQKFDRIRTARTPASRSSTKSWRWGSKLPTRRTCFSAASPAKGRAS